MRRHALSGMLVALLFGLIALSGCAAGDTGDSGATPPDGGTGGETAAPSDAAVTIRDLAFSPSTVEIGVGGAVTWTNEDSAPHTVTGGGGMDSGTLATGDSYTATFDQAGTYDYGCTIHPSMSGTVVVR